jgi:hypothetical protein
MAEVNATTPRTDIPAEAWPDAELPTQMGGQRPPLMPGADAFRLPVEIPQLWDTVNIKDGRSQQEVTRLRLKFDKDHPLVVVGGPRDGETLTATFTSNPRPRGKKDDPSTPWISDLAYLLEVSLADKSRPKTIDALKAAINKGAGKVIRLEHGLSAHCRDDKPRYIENPDPSSDAPTIEDPTKTPGCGERFYTQDFVVKDEQGNKIKDKDGKLTYSDMIGCDCGAIVRGFPNVERFLPPSPAGGK